MGKQAGTVGVVVARRKSKRVPGKVLRPLLGVPLVAWSVRAALASNLERVIISTEDSEIAGIAKAHGAEVLFLRPAALAEDFAEDQDILLHALDAADHHAGHAHRSVVLLQSTTPFVAPGDIDRCLDRLHATGAGCVFTVRKATEPPEWMFTVTREMQATPFRPGSLEKERQHAQKLPGYYLPNGAAYAMRADAVRAQRRIYCEPLYCVEMPPERSIDIDEEIDLVTAEAVGRHFGFTLAGARSVSEPRQPMALAVPLPELVGARVTLRRFDASQISAGYLAWLNDAEVNRFSRRGGRTTTEAEARQYLADRSADEAIFAIHVGALGHVGNLKLGPVDWVNRRSDISILIGERSAWGRGIGTEALYLATRFAFDVLRLNRVDAGSANPAFIKAVTKIGWKTEGLLRERVRLETGYVDWTLLAQLASEFRRQSRFEPGAIASA